MQESAKPAEEHVMLKPKVSSPKAATLLETPRVAPRVLVPAPPPAYDLPGELQGDLAEEAAETGYIDETLDDPSAHQTTHELRPLGARVALHETERELLVLSDGRDGQPASDVAPTVPAIPRLRQRG
jgi:hypothetical protein